MKIDNKTALKLYECMLRIRHTEETIAERYTEWKMRCPTHLSTGQEAVATGVCSALRKDDFVLSTHRCHAHYLAKGGDLNKMIAEIYGKVTGCTSGKGGSMHLIDKSVGFMGSTSIVGNSIPLAVGLGLSIKLQKTDQVSCVFFGDATAEEGVFFESINFAVLKELPVLFICENNFYSVYSPLSVRQPEGRNIFEMVRGLGIASEHGDGNDCLEVYTRTRTAIENIRRRKRPYFIEFDTYRWREHCGPFFDNDLGYRTKEEFVSWKEKDPIVMIETYLLNDYIITEKQLQKTKESAQSGVDRAFDFAEESPFPDPEEAFANLYAE
ncbi:MAG: thiamine pyrophosphate-dependent dehydrogenase E1 component subunit alpha [Bacteroidetes bacterium]|nr:thiamine pyrophosphate-dependent dehydrogenase E1 component subunit alpha [Bacteroidota bacterium]